MSQYSKTVLFLSLKNTDKIIKYIYQRHITDGGQKTLAAIKEQIPYLMKNWNRASQLDAYESLIFDEISEMEAINKEFINTYWPLFSVGDDYKTLPRLETPADYHNLSTKTVSLDIDITVQNDVYRDMNAFPVWQRSRYKHQDRSHEGNGMQGRSLDRTPASCGDMEEVISHVDKPYSKIDEYDVPYYGQSRDEGSSALTSSLWKSS
jgi:hypothetical protein